jgi:hypothetical protein
MAASLKLLPGSTVRWRGRRYLIVELLHSYLFLHDQLTFADISGTGSEGGCCCSAPPVSNIWRKIALMGSVWPVRAMGCSLVEVRY